MINSFVVKPLVGFNDIKFGMSRAEVHNNLGMPVKEFKKSKFSKALMDNYFEYHIYYDENDRCEAVEFFGDVKVSVDEQIIFPNHKATVEKMNYNFSKESDGLISYDSSIGIYAPGDEVESVLFGVKNYYL